MMRTLLVTLLLATGSVAGAETITQNPTEGGSIDLDTTPVPQLRRAQLVRQWVEIDPGQISHAVNSNKIFLNNCKPNGCVVRPGNASSQNTTNSQGSWGINSTRTLTPFHLSDAQWNQVVACMQDVFTPFGTELVTTDPCPAGQNCSVPHFEVMIAGAPGDLGFPSGVGGIAPFNCGAGTINNALVFDFSKVWGSDIEEICSTAAQEIAHAWALDHVTDASDPLTYFAYNGRRKFKNAQVQCGSDCVGGQSPFGRPCSGPANQSHSCECFGFGLTGIMANTQNSVERIQSVFGTGTPTPPIVDITKPKTGEKVMPGFPVSANASDNNGVAMVQLFVDNMPSGTVMAPPYAFNAPATLGDGTHTVRVVATDSFGAVGSKQVSVIIGAGCTSAAQCPSPATDVCIGGRCAAGPSAPGGLGTACTDNTMCASNECASDNTGARHCVEHCDPSQTQCPDGFGCLPSGASDGVCWPGYDDGTGCGCSTNEPDPVWLLVLGVVGFAIARRRVDLLSRR